jgi:osmotically-inducible protein OsmY
MTALLARNRVPARPHPAGRWLLSGIAAGAGLAFLFDPSRGRQRRERIAGAVRHARRRLGRRARAASLQTIGRTKGALHALRSPTVVEPLDDAGLAHKVESVLFRDPLVPKGRLSINAEGGTVFLRGQVESQELIDDLTESVGKIAGVGEVVSLLHLPGTPAPHHG